MDSNTTFHLPTVAPKVQSPVLTFALVGAATLTALYWSFKRPLVDKDGNSIPLGPKGFPILGSFPFLTKYPELTFDRWAKKFGDLYSVWIGNQLYVILSSPEVVRDLVVNNGTVFSSRKDMFVKSQTVLAGRGITATPYNDKWRKHRRLAAEWLTQRAVDNYTPIIDREATVLIKSMYQETQGGTVPINPQPHAGRTSLNNMLSILFGTRTRSVYDPLVGQALKISREFMNVTGPVANLVDFIPILQKIRTPMLSRGQKLHQALLDTYGGMLQDIDLRMQMGEDVPDCFSKAMLETQKGEMDHLDMSILVGTLMIAGTESTAAIMQWFSALIPAYPDIQARAHEELDRVVGRDRMPTIEDEENLPFCHAIIKEVERCHNPFWLGTPHYASEDFTYKGQFIPKGTVVILNTWTMHHDPTRHADPHSFNPERYMHDNLPSSKSAKLGDPYARDHWMFGAGRRICPGMLLAEREIWLTLSRMLWAFKMEALLDEPIDLKEYDGLSGRSPVPFRINLIPRDVKIAEVLALYETPA